MLPFRSPLGRPPFRLSSGAAGYLGAEHPERWLPYLGRYALTVASIPTAPVDPTWILERIPALVVASLAALFGLAAMRGADEAPESVHRPASVVSRLCRGSRRDFLFSSPASLVDIALAAFLLAGLTSRGGMYDPGGADRIQPGYDHQGLAKGRGGLQGAR